MVDLLRKDKHHPPLLVGHRGACDVAPENTLASFQRALDDGADILELDVTLSADGHVVVIHDETVDRTTNGTGPVSALTLSELKQLDAGAWFDPQFRGERVPTLGEVFDLVHRRCGVFIELKYGYPHPKFNPALVEAVCALIGDFGVADRVALISYTYAALDQAKSLLPALAVGPMLPYVKYHHGLAWASEHFPLLAWLPPVRYWLLSPLRHAQALAGDFVSPSIEVVTSSLVCAAHAAGLPVSPGGRRWNYGAAIRMGVDTISSNNPGVVRRQVLGLSSY